MAEEQPPRTEQIKQLEILDFPKYGTLYGRFLLASQAKTLQEAANIIDSNKTVDLLRDLQIKDDALEKKNYNPPVENFSINERQEQWKDFIPSTEHSTAYSQWRTEFTGFMTGSITDSKRESALRVIMPNLKQVADFTEDDADQLFNDFCNGGSDINKFIMWVTKNLADNGQVNPTNLQELLPHLQWIASGLFGKNTASDVVTRLIELESAMHNNTNLVLDTLLNNDVRINTPTDDEKRILGFLHDSFPVRQEIKTFTIESTPPAAPVIPVITDENSPPAETSSIEGRQGNDVAFAARETTANNNFIDMGHISPDDLPKELNRFLSQDRIEPLFSVSFSPAQLKEYILTSLPKSYEAQAGEIEVDRNNNRITIRDVKFNIPTIGGTATFDLSIGTTYNSIVANIENYRGGLRARRVRGTVENKIKAIDSVIKQELSKQIVKDNPAFSVTEIYIHDGRVLVIFNRSRWKSR